MKQLVFAAALLVSCVAPQQAFAKPYSAKATIAEFTEAEIAPVLTNRGITITDRYTTDDGAPALQVTFANGLIGHIVFTAKLEGTERRVGMGTFIYFNPRKDWSEQRKIDTINEYNRMYWLTQATMASDGQIYIMRYSVSDFGTPMGNLNSELWSMETLAKRFQEKLGED